MSFSIKLWSILYLSCLYLSYLYLSYPSIAPPPPIHPPCLFPTICPSPRFHCTLGESKGCHVGETNGRRRRTQRRHRNDVRTASRRKHDDRETGACGTNCRHRASPGQLQLETGRRRERSCADKVGGEQGGKQGQTRCPIFFASNYLNHVKNENKYINPFPHFDNSHCRLLLRQCPFQSFPHRLSMPPQPQHLTPMPHR